MEIANNAPETVLVRRYDNLEWEEITWAQFCEEEENSRGESAFEETRFPQDEKKMHALAERQKSCAEDDLYLLRRDHISETWLLAASYFLADKDEIFTIEKDSEGTPFISKYRFLTRSETYDYCNKNKNCPERFKLKKNK